MTDTAKTVANLMNKRALLKKHRQKMMDDRNNTDLAAVIGCANEQIQKIDDQLTDLMAKEPAAAVKQLMLCIDYPV